MSSEQPSSPRRVRSTSPTSARFRAQAVTSPIRTQTGSLDTLYCYEVIPELAGAQLFIGNDLINRVVGPDYLAGKFTLPGTTDDAPAHAVDAPAHAVDAPAPLVSSDFNEEEESSEFQAFRETVVQAIAPELAANAAISRTSFCPLFFENRLFRLMRRSSDMNKDARGGPKAASFTGMPSSPMCANSSYKSKRYLRHSMSGWAVHQMGEKAVVGIAPILDRVDEAWWEVGSG